MGILDVSFSFVDKKRMRLAEILDVANLFTRPPRSMLCVIVIDDAVFYEALPEALARHQ
jgi:hypothetical protein